MPETAHYIFRYILEMSLMEYGVNVDVSESEVAAGCLVLAFKMKGIKVGLYITLYFV